MNYEYLFCLFVSVNTRNANSAQHPFRMWTIIDWFLISQFYFVISDKVFYNIIQVTYKRQQCVSGTALYIKSCETIAEDKR